MNERVFVRVVLGIEQMEFVMNHWLKLQDTLIFLAVNYFVVFGGSKLAALFSRGFHTAPWRWSHPKLSPVLFGLTCQYDYGCRFVVRLTGRKLFEPWWKDEEFMTIMGSSRSSSYPNPVAQGRWTKKGTAWCVKQTPLWRDSDAFMKASNNNSALYIYYIYVYPHNTTDI